MDNEVVDVRMCRPPQELGPTQVYFRPALIYQELLPEGHVCDGSLEFSLDFSTGRNRARFSSTPPLDIPKGTARHDSIMADQLRCVPDHEARNDTNALRDKLLVAGTFGDAEALAHLIRTCYVTQILATEVLAECCSQGQARAAQVLLDAGAHPAWPDPTRNQRTALHAAAAAGHEEACTVLLRAVPNRAAALLTTASGETAFGMLRNQDMTGAARRLEALLNERFPEP